MGEAPRLVLTGAAGFVGQRLIRRLGSRWRIVALDRVLPARSDEGDSADVRWIAVDLAERDAVAACFDGLRREGGAHALVHLAAHYDFSGDEHPEYTRTNVEGTRHLLDACEGLGLERFVFASSVAACDFVRGDEVLHECTPPDGDHAYARSKRAGEELVRRETRFPTAIVRFAALYSDWCEYAPLFHFLGTWTSGRWNSRVLGGRGRSAVPYLHVRDATLFVERLLALRRDLLPAELLLASPNGATSHAELFRAATAYASGAPRLPLHVPRPLAWLGMAGLDLIGRARGRRPFERPWMARMIDRRLDVDARHTHARLGWAPRPRLDVVRRIPFLIENQRSEPGTWAARNEAMLHTALQPVAVQILRLFEEHEAALFGRLAGELRSDAARFPHYQELEPAEIEWRYRQMMRTLSQAVRTRQRGPFRAYCHDLARLRITQGLGPEELRAALALFERQLHEELASDARTAALSTPLNDLVTRTIEFGFDGIDAAYDEAGLGDEAPR
jgi:nucleoside-diphosphate-sugar epimerase